MVVLITAVNYLLKSHNVTHSLQCSCTVLFAYYFFLQYCAIATLTSVVFTFQVLVESCDFSLIQ